MSGQYLELTDSELIDFFGDRGVWFCQKEGKAYKTVADSSVMRSLFEVLHAAEGLLFFRCVPDATERGLLDTSMDLAGYKCSPDGVVIIETHNTRGTAYDRVFMIGECPESWFQENGTKPGVRAVVKKTLEFDPIDRWDDTFENILESL